MKMPSWKDTEGKWNEEPDFFCRKDNGSQVAVVRHHEMGNLNGYVGVNAFHPLFGLHYDHQKLDNIRVHGGLTYSGMGEFIPESNGRLWYFGFDTIHAFDLAPFTIALRDGLPKLGLMRESLETYRDMNYVSDEALKLLEQLKEVSKNSTESVNHKRIYRKMHKIKTNGGNRNEY